MNCIYLKIRSKKYEKYFYCQKKKTVITYKDCKECKNKEYKKIKELKKQSKKQKKLEAKRYSIITDNLKNCYICCKNKKDDLHEVFGGSNRKKSMQWGLVIPICRECHTKWDTDKELRRMIQQEVQQIFEKEHSHKLFMTEFKMNYKER